MLDVNADALTSTLIRWNYQNEQWYHNLSSTCIVIIFFLNSKHTQITYFSSAGTSVRYGACILKKL